MNEPKSIRRLLIANRGEIARRITRSARSAGITVVAVYAASDADAPHVRDADLAVVLRGRGATGTYLDVGQILAAAVATGADAVHPGYGFLSERAAFATAVLDAGLTWVGPPPSAIAAMGDKLSAKRLMAGAGVPVLPTLELPMDAAPPADLPAGMRVPLIVKAAAGGGGKGMRVVSDLADLPEAVTAARREAAASFGDATVFVEPYVAGARHVEIQVLADDHDHVVHCFERDCSIQRRHQKVIEEAPSPALDAGLRARMGEAAVAAARAVGYRSAGTVEFVLDAAGGFWFLEVNTRLQVEHPVTEAITGLDLVREQLRIATGHPLSVVQEDLHITGHAVEARLYAEDPASGWLPATGTLVDWAPAADPPVRWDSGVEAGSVVGVEWDPMLAKVIAHASTRHEAAMRLASALERSRIRGVTTNRDFLVAALRHPAFLAGAATTDFVTRADLALARTVTLGEVTVAAVAAALSGQARRRAAAGVLRTLPTGWTTGVLPAQTVSYLVAATPPPAPPDGDASAAVPEDRGGAEAERTVEVTYRPVRDGSWSVDVDGATHVVHFRADPPASRPGGPAGRDGAAGGDGAAGSGHERSGVGRSGVGRSGVERSGVERFTVEIEVDGMRTDTDVMRDGATWWVQSPWGDLKLEEQPRFPEPEVAEVAGGLIAPMPGRVIEVATAAGDTVEAGALLVIVEAMKMEHRVTAPRSGVVTAVRVAAGDQVAGGDLLVVVEPVVDADVAPAEPEPSRGS